MAIPFPNNSNEPLRFALIGWGWRAEFYARIAKEMPSRFVLTTVLLRNEQKANALSASTGLRATTSFEEVMATAPDFVVSCVARGGTLPTLSMLFERGVPVLTETPPAESIEELKQLWRAAQRTEATVQVAEQYPYQPLYSAWQSFVDDGGIGDVTNISLSALHGYHGMAVIRRILATGYEDASIDGERFTFPLTETMDRGGPIVDGPIVDSRRDRATLRFASGKVAFFDFADPAQYHSYIRTRQLNVQGTKGEIDDLSVRYIGPNGLPVSGELVRIDSGRYNNQGWSHKELRLGERVLYTSPFQESRLNDDEIAVGVCLENMGKLVRSGRSDGYSLAEALHDTYLALLVEQAVSTPRTLICSERMPWAD